MLIDALTDGFVLGLHFIENRIKIDTKQKKDTLYKLLLLKNSLVYV